MQVRLTATRRLPQRVMVIVLMIGAGVAGAMGTAQADSGSARLSSVAQAEIAAGNAAFIPEAQLAVAGCGSACDGRNPQTFKIYYNGSSYYKCSEDATTGYWEEFYDYGGPLVEIRMSARCRTAWTLLHNGNFNPSIKSYTLSYKLRTSYSGFAGSYYTNMVNNKGLQARGCAKSGPIEYCTVGMLKG